MRVWIREFEGYGSPIEMEVVEGQQEARLQLQLEFEFEFQLRLSFQAEEEDKKKAEEEKKKAEQATAQTGINLGLAPEMAAFAGSIATAVYVLVRKKEEHD